MAPQPPISVLHVVLALNPGGLENGIVNLARTLDSDAFRSGICCLEQAGAFAQRLPPATPVFTLAKPPGLSPAAVLGLTRVIRSFRPQIVHTHNLGPLIYSAGATVFGRTVPLLHGEHRELFGRELRPSRLRLRRMLYRSCRKIHTVSTALRDSLRQQGFTAADITAIPNGVDTEKFRPGVPQAARRALDLPENAPVIGIVGALRPEKGQAELIQAFDRLPPGSPPLQLLVVGGGPEAQNLRRLAAATSAAKRIHFTGHRDDLPRCYQAMDLMALPSRAEGLANAVLEALACAVPVMVSDVCGNRDVVTENRNGFLLPTPISPETLATALAAALQNRPRLATLGQTGRTIIAKHFALADMTAGYAALYRSIVDPGLPQV